MHRKHPLPHAQRHLLLGMYPGQQDAHAAVHHLLDRGFPIQHLSLLARADNGDGQAWGVCRPGPSERLTAWGGLGMSWGRLFQRLGGAAGMFLVPGLGALLAAGPFVEGLAASNADAATAHPTTLSQLALAAHRIGIPREAVEAMELGLHRGHHLLILIVEHDDTPHWQQLLEASGIEDAWDVPYLDPLETERGGVGD